MMGSSSSRATARGHRAARPADFFEDVVHARRREGWIEVEDDGADDLVDELFGVDERAVEVEDDDAGHGVREAPRDGGERGASGSME